MPTAVVDALLRTTIAAGVDHIWIEPDASAEDSYMVTVAREGRLLGTSQLEARVAIATIARLAYITNVDLGAGGELTGMVRVRADRNERELVFTLTPGPAPKATVMYVMGARAETGPTSLAARDELSPGLIVGHYRIVHRLGSGGMGSIYMVEHQHLGRRYALKVMHNHLLVSNPSSAEQFLAEARAAAAIHSPHVVDVFDCGHLCDGRPYYVMELLAGTSLAKLIDRGAVAPAQAVAIARQIADGLIALHRSGVVHGDVSTANVMIDETHPMQVKLVDLARSRRQGTPAYVAPEIARNGPADESSDQYAFGVVLWELLAGAPPFEAPTLRELYRKHVLAPVPVPTSPFGALPPTLTALIERCLAKSPEQRFTSMEAVSVALAALQTELSGDKPRPDLAGES